MLKLDHLSREDHEQAAALLRRVQDDLLELTHVVCQKAIQERLIDPLRDSPGWGYAAYPNVHYAVGRVK